LLTYDWLDDVSHLADPITPDFDDTTAPGLSGEMADISHCAMLKNQGEMDLASTTIV
jgi:hypothetical protein